ncbi:MAG: HAD-IIIC family phosphatase [Clostridia bacterium]|nr:HAD-IIIC family phosphatase [Clostridia bacterium]
MSAVTFLSQLRKLGVKLWLEEGELRFQAPKGVMTKEIIAELSQRKNEIISFLRQVSMGAKVSQDPIIPISREAGSGLPLSYSQQSMWFYDQLIKGNPAFNISSAVKIVGHLDIAAIKKSLNKLLIRHESLRTTFKNVDGVPMQIISNPAEVELPEINLSHLAEEKLDIALKKLLREESRKSFNLERGPLFRFCLYITGENEYVLSMTIHHIICDAWSNGIFIGELFKLYGADVEGRTIDLPQLSVQFADYSAWERNRLKGDLLEEMVGYWRKQLANPTTLHLPIDRPHSKNQSYEGGMEQIHIPGELSEKLKAFCLREGTTLFMVVLAALQTLLYRYSGQEDIFTGTVVANRNRKEIENVTGFFMNTLVLRSNFEGNPSFLEVLRQVKQTTLDAYTYQELPFDKLLEELKPERQGNRTPLFQVMFILQSAPKADFKLPGAELQQIDFDAGLSPFELRLQLTEMEDGLKGAFDYSLALFDPDTIRRMSANLISILEIIVQEPDKRVAELPCIDEAEMRELEEKRRRNNKIQEVLKLAVAATFTSEPIQPYISWWCRQFGIETEVHFAPYNQVFQELLDEKSLISSNKGANILLVRFEDWIRDDRSSEDEQIRKIDSSFNDLVSMLKSKIKKIPYFIGVFPVSTHLQISDGVREYIEKKNEDWKNVLEGMGNVYAIDFRELANLYNIYEEFDSLKDREGHMPFTDEYYAALGTAAARKICAWQKQHFKVIVLDCDNTLWKGVCGEDGAQGVKIEGPYRELQEFILERNKEGMLLALCSKNIEADVWEVFEKNSAMVLKKEHFIGHRINWEPKSANIKELAKELNLGLDSFIFIDDNVAECAEVMANSPEVLTLQLPNDESQVSAYLGHVWAFDKLKVTEEDAMRTKMYMAEKMRQSAQESGPSLESFIKGLGLKMSMNLVEDDQFARVAQLTQRTNQFNLSTIRRTEEDIKELVGMPGTKCYAVEVSDRFGDYGLVGVVITKQVPNKLIIDTFLLSCRVLGRGVDDAILGGLRKFCTENGIQMLEADFYPTEKNMPFIKFIERTGWNKVEETDRYIKYHLSIEAIPSAIDYIECHYNSRIEGQDKGLTEEKQIPVLQHTATNQKVENGHVDKENTWEVKLVNEEGLIHRSYLLPLQNSRGQLLLKLPVNEGTGGNVSRAEYLAPRNDIEEKLVEIWQRILGIERIGVNDNFFALGGQSLLAITLISEAARVLHKDITLQDLFENPTVAQLAENLNVDTQDDTEFGDDYEEGLL